VIFSENSSEKAQRNVGFRSHINAIQEAVKRHSKELDLPEVKVEGLTFKHYTVEQQIQIVSKAAIFVTACGGGSVTAMFLPRGASVVIYFPEQGGVENNRWSSKPARLDWDYFNNIGYLSVHWIPTSELPRRYGSASLESFTNLVLHELHRIQIGRERLRRNSNSH
jgi:hypothetical protein